MCFITSDCRHLLLTSDELSAVYSLRKAMSTMPQTEITEQLLAQMMATKTNKELVDKINIIFTYSYLIFFQFTKNLK